MLNFFSASNESREKQRNQFAFSAVKGKPPSKRVCNARSEETVEEVVEETVKETVEEAVEKTVEEIV
jgi:hypothetical protein